MRWKKGFHVAYKHFKLHKIGFGNRYKLQNNFAKGNCHFLSFVDMFALFCEQFIFVAYVSKHGSKSSLLSLFIVENVEISSLMKSFVIAEHFGRQSMKRSIYHAKFQEASSTMSYFYCAFVERGQTKWKMTLCRFFQIVV